MKAKALQTEEASNKWWAVQDRRMRNAANATLYSETEKVRAERMRVALGEVYSGTVYEPSFGKRGISIKVAKASVADRKNLRSLEAQWDSQGVIKKISTQGIIYNIPKV